MISNHTIYDALPQLTSCRGRHPWHVCRYSQTGLYWSTHPCPWLNISAEIVHSPSFKERKMSKFEMTRQSLQCSSLWNFFQPLQFAIKSAPSMSSLFNLLLSFEKESTLLLIASVINKLSTLSAPSMIDFFFTNFNLSNTTKHILLDSLLQEVRVTEIQIATCLIRLSLCCLIHFSKRFWRPKSK